MNGKIAIMLLVFSLLVFADVGPISGYTSITVTFTKDSQAYTGPVSVIYHCQDPEVSPGEGPVDTVEVELSCSSGVCRNDNWFNRLNPCYDSKRGFLKYKTPDDPAYLSTGLVYPEGSSAAFNIDLDSSEVTEHGGVDGLACAPSFLFAALAVLILNVEAREIHHQKA